MDIIDYQILIDLYEHKNITKVANIHYISQPAITKRIAKIESELNCQLIVSNNKGIMFTDFGDAVIPYCRQIVKSNNALRLSINQMQGLTGGSVNIMSSPNYSRYKLPSVIKKFSELYPFVNLNIIVEKSRNIHTRILKEKNIIGIMRCEHQTHDWNLENILMSTEPMCLIYSHDNSNRSLGDYNFIAHNVDAAFVAQIERWASEHNISLDTTKVCVDDINSCMEMVELGLGWSIAPRLCLDNFKGVIHDLYFEDQTPFNRKTHVVYHRSYCQLQQVRLFLDVLLEYERQYT
jgi:DNA-binding transcriptional LysR family regulator